MNIAFMKLSMLSVDMGLAFKFETDSNGRPTGCPGMDSKKWLANRNQFSDNTDCPLNMADAVDGMVMAEVMKLYAGDNKVWVEDFMAVYHKMLENGVDGLYDK